MGSKRVSTAPATVDQCPIVTSCGDIPLPSPHPIGLPHDILPRTDASVQNRLVERFFPIGCETNCRLKTFRTYYNCAVTAECCADSRPLGQSSCMQSVNACCHLGRAIPNLPSNRSPAKREFFGLAAGRRYSELAIGLILGLFRCTPSRPIA